VIYLIRYKIFGLKSKKSEADIQYCLSTSYFRGLNIAPKLQSLAIEPEADKMRSQSV